MSSLPKIFIIVLSYNGGKLIKNCLKSLQKVDYQNLSIVVIDNNSQDDSVKKIRVLFPKVTVIENSDNIGFAGGNNIGIRYALKNKADYVLLLNQDTEVEPDFLIELIKIASKDSQIGLLSPLIFWKKTKQVWFSKGEINWFNMKSYHQRKLVAGDPFQSEFLTGCSLLIRREVFEKIGLLDERFFLYWEDADFSLRAKKLGFEVVVVPNSKIYHFEDSEIANKNKVYWLVLSGLIFFKKHTPWFFRPWLWFFVKVRKIKNWLDRKKKKKDVAELVYKAYQDFKNVKL